MSRSCLVASLGWNTEVVQPQSHPNSLNQHQQLLVSHQLCLPNNPRKALEWKVQSCCKTSETLGKKGKDALGQAVRFSSQILAPPGTERTRMRAAEPRPHCPWGTSQTQSSPAAGQAGAFTAGASQHLSAQPGHSEQQTGTRQGRAVPEEGTRPGDSGSGRCSLCVTPSPRAGLIKLQSAGAGRKSSGNPLPPSQVRVLQPRG